MIEKLVSDLVIIVSVPLIGAVIINWIWEDEPKKESKNRPGEYINSEIEEEDKN